jgi:hypothetical protein
MVHVVTMSEVGLYYSHSDDHNLSSSVEYFDSSH